MTKYRETEKYNHEMFTSNSLIVPPRTHVRDATSRPRLMKEVALLVIRYFWIKKTLLKLALRDAEIWKEFKWI